MKQACIAFLFLTLAISYSYAEDAQCSEPIDKSAVTNMAKEAAAKVHQNPPKISSEIYSSKVKSKLSLLHIDYILFVYTLR